jgi:hypothetical protein
MTGEQGSLIRKRDRLTRDQIGAVCRISSIPAIADNKHWKPSREEKQQQEQCRREQEIGEFRPGPRAPKFKTLAEAEAWRGYYDDTD